MRRRRFNIRLFTWTIAALSLGAHPASAQSLLDTPVGQDQFGRPLTSGGMIGHELGALSRATGVPVGFEQIADARMPPRRAAVTLSGLTLRAALDAVVPGVARYEIREMDGVVVLRPNAYWDGARSPLDAAVPPVKLRHTNATRCSSSRRHSSAA